MNFKPVVEKNCMLNPVENLTKYEVKLHNVLLTMTAKELKSIWDISKQNQDLFSYDIKIVKKNRNVDWNS